MSIATEIARIQGDRNIIRTKLMDLGLATASSDLDDLASAVEGIENRGAVSATVQEGDTYTIPKGYHNGSGTVSGTTGGGNYTLQSKSITPTKSQQNVTPDQGYYGLSDVTVGPIPEVYQDVSSVTATAGDVLANKIIVNAAGQTVAGTMPNNGAVDKVLTASDAVYPVPAGYHSGSGTVKIVPEAKTATPSTISQEITPTSGKVLEKVTVEAIPQQYTDTSDADAAPEYLLMGKTAYASGVKLVGTMADNGAISASIDGLTETVYSVPAGYTSGGTVSLTGEIEAALAAI